MKKMLTISISLMCLSIALAVGSFAWYKLPNKGLPEATIKTKDQRINISFALVDSGDASLIPAKLHKGVINDSFGHVEGQDDIYRVPTGRGCLPQIFEEPDPKKPGVTPDFNYIKDSKGEFLTRKSVDKSGNEVDYLVKPATIAYNQFEFQIASGQNDPPGKKYAMQFNFQVKYANVDQDINDTEHLNSFTQTEALSFNFFFMKGNGLKGTEVKRISTIDNKATDKITVQRALYDSKDQIKLISKAGTLSDSTLKINQIDSQYRYEPVMTKVDPDDINSPETVYSFELSNLDPDIKYTALLETYYRLPGALIKGNLPLTGQFVIFFNSKEILNKKLI